MTIREIYEFAVSEGVQDKEVRIEVFDFDEKLFRASLDNIRYEDELIILEGDCESDPIQ